MLITCENSYNPQRHTKGELNLRSIFTIWGIDLWFGATNEMN